jgi:hypothetical protein
MSNWRVSGDSTWVPKWISWKPSCWRRVAGVSGFADRGAGRERHHCYFGGRHRGAFGGLCWCTGVLAVLVEVSVW